MPNHFFIASDGDLHDTRDPHWAARPLRKKFRYTHAKIRAAAEFKATVRNGPYVWPGGYPMFLICSDGAALCFPCARKEARNIIDAIRRKDHSGWRIVACDINYEDTDLYCDHCTKPIESAYGGE